MTKESYITVGKKTIGHDRPIFFIAEIGINHNGDIEIAKKLIDVAIDAGADAVKFQKRNVDVVYTPEELARPRPVESSILLKALKRGVLPKESVDRLHRSHFEESTNGDLKRALELTEAEYREIDRYCKEKGIMWFASPWDEDSVDFLEQFNPPVYKVASPSITDHGLLRHTKSKGKPVIFSTGGSDLKMVEDAIKVLGRDNTALMHCLFVYPAPHTELNLMCIPTLRQKFGLPTGYSGHEVGVSPTLVAAALGACILERHITLDRAMWGSDQAASLEPTGLKRVITYVRQFEESRGDGIKRILPSEVPVMKKLRRK